MREYIVSLKKGINYEEFWNQIENESPDDGFVPTRRVDIVNERPGSLRSCHYELSDEEAAQLRNDPRVFAVEIPPDQRTDIEIGFLASQTSDFTKTTSDSGNFVNWGLRRVIADNNPYGTGTTATGDFTYTLTGSGVDVVIQDSGLQVDHPEFQDEFGESRVQLIDWYQESGLPGTQNVNHYRDFDGHGTHCGGIAAGKTYGWAKNARIYAVKVNGLESPSDGNTGISITDCFDVIKLWHRNKPVDPVTGLKRPTIVNMSWGYGRSFANINGGVYRGVPWTGTSRRTDLGMTGAFTGLSYRHLVRVASVDVDVEELLDEGVHVCIAAGNSSTKIDIPGGTDYNNYYNDTFNGAVYYHRGGSPFGTDALIVGNADSATYDNTFERKAASSETGPGVTLYAPGTNIMSCTSTINRFTNGAYPADNNFRICNISGTSMASPQVCGVGACYLEINPGATPAQLKNWLIQRAKTGKLFDNGNDADYTNSATILGGNNRYLYQQFNSPFVLSITRK